MTRSACKVFSGLGACGVLLALVAGVPVCLVRLVGNPLPSGLPTWSSVMAVVDSGTLPPGVVVRVVAIVVWIWWAQVAVSFATGVVATCRGRTARSLPLRGLGVQPIVVRLVAVVMTAAGAFMTLAQPVFAATASFAEIAVPREGRGSMNGGGEGTSPRSEVVVAPGPLMSPEVLQRPGIAPAHAATGVLESPVPTLAPPVSIAEPPLVGPPDLPAPVLHPPPEGAAVAWRNERAPDLPAPVLHPPPDGAAVAVPGRPGGVPDGEVAGVVHVVPLRDGAGSDHAGAGSDPLGGTRGAPPQLLGVPGQSPESSGSEVVSGGTVGASLPPVGGNEAVLGPAGAAPANSAPGASGVRGSPPVLQPAPTASGEPGWVVVAPGDSLWRLAERHLGDALRWEDIYELNAGPLPGGGTLRDPNLIFPGWRLRLPPAGSEATPGGFVALRSPASPPVGQIG